MVRTSSTAGSLAKIEQTDIHMDVFLNIGWNVNVNVNVDVDVIL